MSIKDYDAAIDEFSLALGLLLRRLRSESPTETRELSWTQRSILKRLEHNGPTTTAELARAESVKPQSMGAAVAALEELGLVERRAHATDGRQMNVALTSKGIAIRKTARDARHIWLAQAVGQLSKREQATLFDAGELIKRLVSL